jgi:hypothetical protein
VAIALAAVVAVAGLAACADDDDGATGPSSSAASTASSAPSTAPTTTSGPTTSSTVPGSTAPAGRTTPTLRQVPLTKGASDLDYDVTGTYAQLDGLDGSVGAAVNAALATKAQQIVAGFERDLRDFGEVPSTGDTRSFVEVAPTATLLDPQLASLRLNAITYVAGAAHPASLIVTATYDLRSGKELALADLFDPARPYLRTVADAATAQLTEQFAQLGADTPFPEGVAPTTANYQAWWLTTAALAIGFPAGQAGAYALGDQKVEIPWADLRALVAPAGPVAALAR